MTSHEVEHQPVADDQPSNIIAELRVLCAKISSGPQAWLP